MNRLALNCFPVLLLCLLTLGVGCVPTRTDTFDIDVRNATTGPITLSLAKDGPPYEHTWATPEDLAIESPKLREEWSSSPSGLGMVVAPGKTAYIRGLKGQFKGDAHGYVRAYAGDFSRSISQMLARGYRSPDRADIPLFPGTNRIVVLKEEGRIIGKQE